MVTRTIPPGELEHELTARLAASETKHPPGKRARRGRGRARARYATVLGVIGMMVLGITGALGFHVGSAALELDGNIANDGAPVTGVADWADLFNPDTSDKAGGDILGAAGNLLDREFVVDFVANASGPDPSYHEPSNKDDQPIFAAGGGEVWGCVSATNPTDKDDILNAYAIAYTGEGEDAGDLILSFGVERFDDSGTAYLGFWVFQNDVTCNTATGKFEGAKTDNDILMLINFSNGGDNVTVNAFAWHPDPDSPNSDAGTFSVIGAGVGCDISVDAGDAGSNPVNMCAITNGTGVDENVPTPWLSQDKEKPGPPNPDPDSVLEPPEFVEGAINLTNAFAAIGQTPPACFGSFMAETRSSDSLAATLKDFALGDLNTCDANISITGNGTNEVGTAHTFTVTVNKNTGGGFVPADNGHVDVTLTGSNGISAGDISINAAASTCDDAGDNLNASGQCILVFNSSVAGTITGHATVTVNLGGGSTLTRDTNPATVGVGAGVGGSETPAVKNYVTGNITIAANDTNKVGDPHTFTVVANATGPVAPTSIAISTNVSPTPDTTNTTTCGAPTMSNGGMTATCTITVNSSVVGVFTANATATFNYSGGLSFQRDTDPATAAIGSGPGGSGPATKTYVDARISIATSGTNKVNDPHTFTVTVEKNLGTGGGWVAAAGVTVSGSETGVGNITGGSCGSGPTNASGQCTIIVNSSAVGTSTVNASATVDVSGVNIAVATNGYGANTVSNTKTWVDARITIQTSGTNAITEPHTFTVTVEQNDGTGWAPAVGIAVNPSETGVGSITGGTCDNSAPDTNASGQCTIIVSSNVAGQSTVNASATVNVSGVNVAVATDGYGAHDISNVKTWVDGSLTWLKHDNNGQLLGGATFQVCRTHDRFGVDITDECVTIVDDVDGVDDMVGDWDGTPGEFKLDGLLLGTYTIEETAAPPGYTLDTFVDTVVLSLASPDGAATHIWVNTPPNEGCTPGYWKNHTSAWDSLSDPTVDAMPAGYEFITTTSFNDYFNLTAAQSGVADSFSMLDAVNANGGDFGKLARHGVSALLNVVAVDYPISDFVGLYDDLRDAFLNKTYEPLATTLAGYNNLDHQNCPA